MLTMVEKVTTELRKENKILVTLGGEHLLTLGTYMSFPKETGYIVFDAHYDLREEYVTVTSTEPSGWASFQKSFGKKTENLLC